MTNSKVIQTFSPFVFWAQNEKTIFLKVDLKDVKDPKVRLDKQKLEFSGSGTGARGQQKYEFTLDFNKEIDPIASSYKVLDSRVDFDIVKGEKCWWSRLISKPVKPSWLKIDFDRWQSNDVDEPDETVRDVRQDYADLYEKLLKEEMGYQPDFKKAWLTLYNVFMFIGFLYILVVMSVRYCRDGVESFPGTYEAVGAAMRLIQLFQLIEILHPIFGYVKGSALASFLQCGGRSLVLFLMIEAEPRVQKSPIIFYLFAAWTTIEIIRYPYYLTQLYKTEYSWLTWLRHSAWIVLYPVGFSCELILIFRNLIFVDQSGKWSITMPNSLNFTFSFATFLRVYLLFFAVPVCYFLIKHMYVARKTKLAPKKHKRA